MNSADHQHSSHDEVHVQKEAAKLAPVEKAVQTEPSRPQTLGQRSWQAPLPALDVGVLASTSAERFEALLCHLGGLLTNFILPLVLLLARRERSPFVAHHARESINFQLTLSLVALVGTLLAGAVAMLAWMLAKEPAWPVGCLVGWTVMAVLLTLWELVLTIWASVAAFRAQVYRYPLCIRIVR